MAMNSLASAAHAAGFAMVPEDDVADVSHKAADDKFDDQSVVGTLVFADGSARWQGQSQPAAEVSPQRSRNGIFDWMPSFSWRADGR
jgi:hypothetical protein